MVSSWGCIRVRSREMFPFSFLVHCVFSSLCDLFLSLREAAISIILPRAEQKTSSQQRQGNTVHRDTQVYLWPPSGNTHTFAHTNTHSGTHTPRHAHTHTQRGVQTHITYDWEPLLLAEKLLSGRKQRVIGALEPADTYREKEAQRERERDTYRHTHIITERERERERVTERERKERGKQRR